MIRLNERCPNCGSLGQVRMYWARFGAKRERRLVIRCLDCNLGGVLSP